MEIFLVGGAVRDKLLKLPIKDRDYVVVGTTAQQMIAKGYRQVGKDFPVFLHPQSAQEYALARTERKVATGYEGFNCYASADVTLEQDLLRRDLTINAIAEAKDGTLHDPYGGITDLNNRVLRHVSDAFVEDPLRVLRVARFAARFHHLGFKIAPETMALMRHITQGGELTTLTPERVFLELDKALSYDDPQIFFEQLNECGALAVLFPEIHTLFGVPQSEQWHPEIDTGIHTLMVLKQAAKLTTNRAVRFAALLHDLGKGATPKSLWPKHHGHGQKGLSLIKQLSMRLKVPNEYRDLALLVSDQHQNIHNIESLKAGTLIKLFDKLDLWRKPERLQHLIIACEADVKGRLGLEATPYPQGDFFKASFEIANSIAIKPIIDAGFQGVAIKQQLVKLRIKALIKFQNQFKEPS